MNKSLVNIVAWSSLILVLIVMGFVLGIDHSEAQTVIDWRTVVASVSVTRTPQPMTPTATMSRRYTWTPTAPFTVRTGLPPQPTETATAIAILPIQFMTVEVTREVTRLVPYYIVVTATPRIVEPVLPTANVPLFTVPTESP